MGKYRAAKLPAKWPLRGTWTKSKLGKWQILVVFPDSKKSPKPGDEISGKARVEVKRKGSPHPAQIDVIFGASRAFRDKETGRVKAFAEVAEKRAANIQKQ